MDLVLKKGREGVQNPETLADVICTQPLKKLLGGTLDMQGSARRWAQGCVNATGKARQI